MLNPRVLYPITHKRCFAHKILCFDLLPNQYTLQHTSTVSSTPVHHQVHQYTLLYISTPSSKPVHPSVDQYTDLTYQIRIFLGMTMHIARSEVFKEKSANNQIRTKVYSYWLSNKIRWEKKGRGGKWGRRGRGDWGGRGGREGRGGWVRDIQEGRGLGWLSGNSCENELIRGKVVITEAENLDSTFQETAAALLYSIPSRNSSCFLHPVLLFCIQYLVGIQAASYIQCFSSVFYVQ